MPEAEPVHKMLGMLLQQPWATLVVDGVFPVLIRSKRTRIRGRVAVVGRGLDTDALVDGKPPSVKRFPQPAIVGFVSIVECFAIPRRELHKTLVRHFGKTFAKFYPAHYIPKRPMVYLWILKSPRRLRSGLKVRRTKHLVWMPIPAEVALDQLLHPERSRRSVKVTVAADRGE